MCAEKYMAVKCPTHEISSLMSYAIHAAIYTLLMQHVFLWHSEVVDLDSDGEQEEPNYDPEAMEAELIQVLESIQELLSANLHMHVFPKYLYLSMHTCMDNQMDSPVDSRVRNSKVEPGHNSDCRR